MNLSRSLGGAVGSLLLILSLTSCGQEPWEDGLRVELSHGTPGFSSPTSAYGDPDFDSNNVQYDGFDERLVQRIAKELGDGVQVVPVGNGLQLRRVDRDLNPDDGTKPQALIAVDAISDTSERRQGRDGRRKMEFAGVYMKSPLSFLVRKDDPQAAALLNGLDANDADARRASNAFVRNPDEQDHSKWDRLKICTKESSTGAQANITDRGGDVDVATTTEGCLEALNKKTVDAVLTDDILLQAFACQGTTDTTRPYGCSSTTAAASPWTIAGRNILPGTQWYGVAIQPGQHSACKAIEKTVQDYVQDTAAWKHSFDASFPVLQDDADVSDYLPSSSDSEGRSCGDGA